MTLVNLFQCPSLQRKLFLFNHVFVPPLSPRLRLFRVSGTGVWTSCLRCELRICLRFFELRLKRQAAQIGGDVKLRLRRLSLRKEEVEWLEDRGEVDAARTAVPVQLSRRNTCGTTLRSDIQRHLQTH